MKGNFELHHGELDLIQPNELSWDHCNQVGQNYINSDISEFMKHVAHHISSDNSLDSITDGYSDDNIAISPVQTEYRPHKASRRDYSIGISGHGEETRKLENTDDQHGLTQITLLLECAVAISVDNLVDANRILLELSQVSSPYAPSCAERIVAYFTRAMASRVMSSHLAIYSPLVPYKTILLSFQTFNNISPFVKFSHFTANQAILESFHQQAQVHIIDLDIMEGLQWPALFHILATRPDGPPRVRMMGLGASIASLQETGKRLSNFAKRLNMQFEFVPIAEKFGNLDFSVVRPRKHEAVAVHWLKHSLYDAVGSDHSAVKLLEALNPRIVTLVEQESLHVGSFLDRFVGSLHYYSTLFDSLGATLATDDSNRRMVEDGLLGREISNILAIGGPARSGEEKFASWRMELGSRSRFMQLPMSSNAMAQAQLILNMYPPSLGYAIMQGDGTLRLGWKDTALYTASAWTSRLGF